MNRSLHFQGKQPCHFLFCLYSTMGFILHIKSLLQLKQILLRVHPILMSTLNGKDSLHLEQILSFKSTPNLGFYHPKRQTESYKKVAVKHAGVLILLNSAEPEQNAFMNILMFVYTAVQIFWINVKPHKHSKHLITLLKQHTQTTTH